MEKIKEQFALTAEEIIVINAEKKQTDEIGTLLREALANAGKFETGNEEEFLAKDVAVDRLLDAQAAIHEEKKNNNPADLYAAYTALQEAQKYCSKVNDFGIEKSMIALRSQMKEKYNLTPENMKTTNKEIASRQEKILRESEDFYEKSIAETEKNLTEFFDKTEEKTPIDKENIGNPLLKYLEKAGKSNKILCAITLSLAMSGIFFGKESKAETENQIPPTTAEAIKKDATIAPEKTAETIKRAKEKLTELQKSVSKKIKELDPFAKFSLIKNLKDYSAKILEVLKKGDYESTGAEKLLNDSIEYTFDYSGEFGEPKKVQVDGGGNMHEILNMYFNGLKEIQEMDTDVYKETVKKLETLVRDTINLSLSDLKAKYLG